MALSLSISITLSGNGRGEPPTPAAPVFISATITGTPVVGNVLGVSVSRTGYPSPTVAYQWTRNGSNISGATSGTYTLVPTDEGDDIGVDIGLTNTEGSDSGSSNEVTVLAAATATTFDSTVITFDSNQQTFDEAA